jgi:hypothetical protein
MIPFGTGISASLAIAHDLGADDVQAVWIVASYSYVSSDKTAD